MTLREVFYRALGYERVYLPLCEVADTPFPIQGDVMVNIVYFFQIGCWLLFTVGFQLVSSFQLEAQAKQQESEQAKTKLSSVRKMIAKLLKSINEVRFTNGRKNRYFLLFA